MNDQWYAPAITCLVGVGLFWILSTPLVGAVVYPRRLRLPLAMRWSYSRFPEVIGPYHRTYLIVSSLILEAFPLAVWWAGYVTSSPLVVPSVVAEVALSVGWLALLFHYARRPA